MFSIKDSSLLYINSKFADPGMDTKWGEQSEKKQEMADTSDSIDDKIPVKKEQKDSSSEIVGGTKEKTLDGYVFSSGFCIRGNSENNCDNF